jgi:hypothetical protein
VPERLDEAPDILGRGLRRRTPYRVLEHTCLVEQSPIRPVYRQVARASADQLHVTAIGEDDVQVGRVAEVLDQQGLAELPNQVGAFCDELVKGGVGGDQADVDVRVGSASPLACEP